MASHVRIADAPSPNARTAAPANGAARAAAWLMPGEPGHTTMEDCDTLLSAVESRLRSIVDSTAPVSSDGVVPMHALAHADPSAHLHAHTHAQFHAHVRTQVLECVQALEQLQALLAHELERRGGAPASAAQLQAQLTQALAELARTRSEERQAQHRALHDGLTLLPNRSFFRQRLDRALDAPALAAQPLAVLYLDLDGMKQINDRHGHCVGDRLLQVVASRLIGAVRSADMVSRQGGDEFALLLSPPPDRDSLATMALKLFDTVAAPVQLGELQLQVRASIGIAVTPKDGRTAETLLHHADAAMYEAKRQQSRYAFFDAMTAA